MKKVLITLLVSNFFSALALAGVGHVGSGNNDSIYGVYMRSKQLMTAQLDPEVNFAIDRVVRAQDLARVSADDSSLTTRTDALKIVGVNSINSKKYICQISSKLSEQLGYRLSELQIMLTSGKAELICLKDANGGVVNFTIEVKP